jgi:spermidine synthase
LKQRWDGGEKAMEGWGRPEHLKTGLHLGFLLMGFSFTVTQALLIRELMVAFFGNELSIGLILGNWLILEAIGSGFLGRWSHRWGGRAASFAALQVLFALFLPLCVLATYASRSLLGAIPGEGVGLVPIFWSSFLILAPVAVVDGTMFVAGSRVYARLTAGNGSGSGEARAIGLVYVLEAVGAIVGGLAFTYVFLTFLSSVQIVLVLLGLNLLSAGWILGTSALPTRGRIVGLIAVAILLAVSLGLLVFPLSEEIQRWATRQQWAGQNLVYSENSVYGNVAVVQQEGQVTFYADGIPILTAPVPDVALVEEIVHLPMLFVPQPRRVLVLSGGVGGVLHELSKYPLERIDYAELDPLLIEAVREFPTPLTLDELGDPRVHVEQVDGRLLVRRRAWALDPSSQARYDLVLLNLPYPSTLQLNRFYTVEFLEMVGRLLSENGVLVMASPGTLTYMSDELRNLNAMAYQTLKEAFAHVRPIPGDYTLWLASSSEEVEAAPLEALVDRWEERAVESRLVTAAHIRLRLEQRYLDWFWASLGLDGAAEEAGTRRTGRAYVNRDLQPVGLFYGLSYWNALFSPGLARVFAMTGRLKLWTLGLLIVGGCSLFVLITRARARGKGTVVPLAIATTGFTGMTADLVIIFAFQTLYGYVYHWIGLLITAFMAGLSLGGWLMTRRLARIVRLRSALLRFEIALVLFWVLLPMLLGGLYTRITHPLLLASMQGILFVSNALAGFLVGSQFPLANKIWLKDREAGRGVEGVLYASDLVGAFLGAILVSVVLIPVLGIVATCVVAALLKVGSLFLVACRAGADRRELAAGESS